VHDRPANLAPDGASRHLQQDGPDDGADETGERDPRRALPARQEERREPGARERPEGNAGEREELRDEAALVTDESRERDPEENQWVDPAQLAESSWAARMTALRIFP
jgi:hypothetical protein